VVIIESGMTISRVTGSLAEKGNELADLYTGSIVKFGKTGTEH
jgi:hypothetical protein